MTRSSSAFQQWAPRLVVGLTAFVPLLFHFAFYDNFDLPKMVLISVVVLVLGALWVWQGIETGWAVHPTGVGLPLLAFAVVALASCWGSLDISRSLFGSYRSYVYGCLPMMFLFGLFFLTAQIQSNRLAQNVAVAAIVSAALVGLYALLQYTGNEFLDLMPKIEQGRVWSSLGNPVYLGAIAAMAIPLALRPWSAGRALGSLGILAGLLLSFSRGAWLGAILSVGFLAIIHRRKARAHATKLVVACAALLALAVIVPSIRQRVLSAGSIRESSNAARVEGWKAGLKIWRDHPLLGSGPDTFFEAFRPYRSGSFIQAAGVGVTQAHAHNESLQVASTLGTLGFVSWMWLLAAFVLRLRRLYRAEPTTFFETRGPWLAALLAVGVQNQFNPQAPASAAWTAIFAGLLIRTPELKFQTRKPWPIWIHATSVLALVGVGLWVLSIPTRADLFYKEGVVLNARGNPVSAYERFTSATRLRPDNEVYQTSLGNTARTLAQMIPDGAKRQELWNDAWTSAQESARRHPANPDAWNDLGVVAMWLTQQGGMDKMAEAKSAFDKAIALDPVFVDAWSNLAKWYHIAGQNNLEIETWKKVLQWSPKDPMALQVLSGHA